MWIAPNHLTPKSRIVTCFSSHRSFLCFLNYFQYGDIFRTPVSHSDGEFEKHFEVSAGKELATIVAEVCTFLLYIYRLMIFL